MKKHRIIAAFLSVVLTMTFATSTAFAVKPSTSDAKGVIEVDGNGNVVDHSGGGGVSGGTGIAYDLLCFTMDAIGYLFGPRIR